MYYWTYCDWFENDTHTILELKKMKKNELVCIICIYFIFILRKYQYYVDYIYSSDKTAPVDFVTTYAE